MPAERARKLCAAFPHVTEQVQWGNDLVFKIGGKMFAVIPLDPAPKVLAFKCTPELFAELIERPGVSPAAYLARAQWVSLDSEDAIAWAELKDLLRQAYDVVLGKLPKKQRAALVG